MKLQPWKWSALALVVLSLFAPSLHAQTCDSLPGLAYGTYVDRYGQSQDLLLDLLLPSSWPAPVVIFIHGGGWKSGSRTPIPSRVTDLCAQGYAVASIDYRLTGTAIWPAQIQDVRGAVRWLRGHAFVYGLDPDRFAAWGESAGAHLAALLGTSGGVSEATIGGSSVDLEGTTGGFLGAALAETSGAGSVAAEALVLPSTAGGTLADPNRPFVSLSATDRDASEPGTNQGAFTVWRTGSTAEPLTVQVTAGGSADSVSDYVLHPATVTFPAGADRVVVSVEPLEDYLTEETESVTLSVEPDPGIDLGPYAGSRVALADDDVPGLPVVLSLTVSPATVTGGVSAAGTVALDRAAPAGGSVVSLSTSNSSAATVPASVTVAAGSTTATFTVTSKPVPATSSLYVTASYRGVGRTAPLTVEAPALSGLTLTPASVAGGCGTSMGRVTLSGKAPTGGLVVTLTGNVPAAAVPASVTVPAGVGSTTFPVATTAVTATQSEMVTASLGGVSRSSLLTVRPIGLLSLALTPNPVVGPGSVTGTVTLECDAPAGGLAVALSSTATAVARPDIASLTVPAGGRTATFPVSTADVSAVSTATIRASANGTTKSVTLTVQP